MVDWGRTEARRKRKGVKEYIIKRARLSIRFIVERELKII